MPFDYEKMNIKDLVLIKPKTFNDNRGYFLEIWKKSSLKEIGINDNFTQENHSYSIKNVIRGLHFQKDPYSQGKLVWVAKGEIWDVAVDLRKNSPTFGKWEARILNDKNHYMFYIPKGFAHGFATLSEDAYVIYNCTDEYDKKSESGIKWNDPDLSINWSIHSPIISDKDEILGSFYQFKETL